jgi:hypothetical protein
MPNSDNKYGIFNKQTTIFSQITTYAPSRTFATVNEALSYFFTTEALAVYNECCTQLQWALVEDSTKLKSTITFGTKGGSTARADDWAEQWNSRKIALQADSKWANEYGYTFEVTDNHLF